jgi:hypothetical protein
MARRKPKTKPDPRITRRDASRLSRSKARRPGKPKKPKRKVPAAKISKALIRRKATTRVKFASRRKKPASKVLKKPVERRVDQDPSLEIAVKDMNRGSSLTTAARSVNLPPKSLQSFVSQHRLAKLKSGKWTIKDTRLRRVPVITKGRVRIVTVRGFEEARLAGEHHNAVGNFVRTNDRNLIKPFTGRSVQAVKGKPHPLETDPNALHRIAAMDTPPFHEIYEITSST